MPTRRLFQLVIAAATALPACSTQERRHDGPPDPAQRTVDYGERPVVGAREVAAVAEALHWKLARFKFPERVARAPNGRAVVALLPLANETQEPLELEVLHERMREAVSHSDRVVFVAESSNLAELQQAHAVGVAAPMRFALLGRFANIRTRTTEVPDGVLIFTLELHDLDRRAIALIASAPIRVSREPK